MEVIIWILVILAIIILFYNIYKLQCLKAKNVDVVKSNKVSLSNLTRFSDNHIKYRIKNSNSYKLHFNVVLNSLSEREELVKTNNWYLDIKNNNLRLVNNTTNDVVLFNNLIEVGKTYVFKITKENTTIRVSLDNESKQIVLSDLLVSNNNNNYITLGSHSLRGKFDLINEIIESFSDSEESFVFVGSDFKEYKMPNERYITDLTDNNDYLVDGRLFYVVHDNKLKMYAVRSDVNNSLIDIRQANLYDGEDVKKFNDDNFRNKFNGALFEDRNLPESKFRLELYTPQITTSSTTTFHPDSFEGCFLPDEVFRTKTDCIKKCIANHTKHCDSTKCQKLCLDCSDKEKCPWIENEVSLNATIPDAPKIRLIPDDKKIIVDWKQPFDGGSEITNYLVLFYESFNKNNGITALEVNNPGCLNCEHVITGLENQKMYDVIVRAVNSKGLGYMSNIETVAPDGPLEGNQISNTLLPTDNEILRDIKNEMNDFVCKQDEYYSLKDYIKNL